MLRDPIETRKFRVLKSFSKYSTSPLYPEHFSGIDPNLTLDEETAVRFKKGEIFTVVRTSNLSMGRIFAVVKGERSAGFTEDELKKLEKRGYLVPRIQK